MKYYINSEGVDNYTAGIKAPVDMCAILQHRHYYPLSLYEPQANKNNYLSTVLRFISWRKIERLIEDNSIIVLQYPYNVSRVGMRFINSIQKKKHAIIVFIIHDIDSLRHKNTTKVTDAREKILSQVDYIICHNKKMKTYLVKRGMPDEKIIPLIMFDYLHNYNINDLYSHRTKNPNIVIAGNLNIQKSSYIYDLLKKTRSYGINLFGPNFKTASNYVGYKYFGQFPPQKLPQMLNGKFGLVWDGDSTKTCSGISGDYLRINNPHKMSLYISSCLPVIVWNKAAVAHYVKCKGLGFCINSLDEIDQVLQDCGENEYQTILENVLKEAHKLTTGYYLDLAMDKIEENIGSKK